MAYLRIGFADYELCPVEAGDRSLLLGTHVCVGLVDHYAHTISYHDDLSGQAQLQTIVHECIHVADYHAQDSRQGEQKEIETDRYANMFLQFVGDNRDFIELIWEAADNAREVKKVACKKPKGKKGK